MNQQQPQPPLYQIIDWNDHFENSRSREIDRCNFVCIPNNHSGIGFRNVLAEPDGMAIYGLWVALLQICSRQKKPRKGFLTVDGKPEGRRLSGEDLARHWGRKVEEIYRVFQVTSRADVGWLRLVDGQHEWQTKAEMTTNCRPTADELPTDCRRIQPAQDEDDNAADQLPTNCRPTAEERRKEGNSNLNVTYHNITVRRGELDNPLKTEEEIPWINLLFQTSEPWSYEELKLLSQLLPIRPESKRLLIWAHNIPPENPFHQMTKLKQARLFLLREFGAEVDKIRTVRRQMGLNGELAPERPQK